MSDTTRIQAFLENLMDVRCQVGRISEKMQYYEDRATAMTKRYGLHTAAKGGAEGLDAVLVLLLEEQDRLAVQLNLLFLVLRQVEKWIELLPAPRHRMVMRYRYLDGLSFSRVRDEIERTTGRDYSDVQIYRIHREALAQAAELWPLEEAAISGIKPEKTGQTTTKG